MQEHELNGQHRTWLTGGGEMERLIFMTFYLFKEKGKINMVKVLTSVETEWKVYG